MKKYCLLILVVAWFATLAPAQAQQKPIPGKGNDFEVIRLRYAKAEAVARTLAEAFNGPRKPDHTTKPPHKGSERTPPGPAASHADRVRIVADRATNSLLVKASPQDTLAIRRLVKEALDVTNAEEPAVTVKPWLIGPLTQTRATNIAKILQMLYRDATLPTKLTIAVDERTNTLILRCTQPLYEEVRDLVRRLDEMPAQKR